MNIPSDAPDFPESISLFQSGSFEENARLFLKSLGYSSDRYIPNLQLNKNNIGQFLTANPINHKTVCSSEYSQCYLLFQLADKDLDLQNNRQLSFSETNHPDPNAITSYFFFAIELIEKEYPRAKLAAITRELNRCSNIPILVLFKYASKLTLAVIHRRPHRRDPTRQVMEKISLIKDIDINQPHGAHQKILKDFSLPTLCNIGIIHNLDELHIAWKKCLNTKELNEKFYRQLADWYYWATTLIKLPILPDEIKDHPDAEGINIKNFTIRLVSRLIFCWFLKERCLIDPSLLELYDRLDRQVILVRNENPDLFNHQNSYYRGILQNIFFQCLNQPMGQRRRTAAISVTDKTVTNPELKKLSYLGKNYLPENFDYSLFDRIPYLNGGLFDILPEDNASDTIEDAVISIPNELFYSNGTSIQNGRTQKTVFGLNYILSDYKFTIAENTPLEEEIALDPELLGLVFENLLAEIDPDPTVSKNARRASGSFYTPRKVIDYMVNESLRLNLETFLRSHYELNDQILQELNDLVYQNNFDPAHKELAGAIVEAFDQIKILDPACGSGAFPMGMLNRIIQILNIVDPDNHKWLHYQLERIPDTDLRHKAEELLKSHTDDYSRKLGLIRNAIYGIDIQPLAILISKLRFFISLLVDQKVYVNDAANNYCISPMPNIETKLICADSLSDLKPRLITEGFYKKLEDLRQRYYQPDLLPHDRENLANQIADILHEVYPDFAYRVTGIQIRDSETDAQRNKAFLIKWFRHATLAAPFFSLEWFFPELHGAGFDVVIGNPPYGGTNITEEVKQSLELGSSDPYGAFIARFLSDGVRPSPLTNKGVLSYIVSDTFMTVKSHRPLRLQMMQNYIHKMIRVHPDTFKATVNTAIILCQRNIWPDKSDHTLDTRHHCQMVDLTTVSIQEKYDRFLEILNSTTGFEERQCVSNPEYAIYFYPQTLISTNSNLPFFVASPKLFTLMNDTSAPVDYRVINEKQVQVRLIEMNGNTIEITRLGQIAEVKVGLQTGDNDTYLYQNPGVRGNYRDITTYRQFLLTDNDLNKIRSKEDIRMDVIQNGISKDNPRSPRYFGGRYIIPYDKGGEADIEEGWLPNYHVPTNYFIDWSEWAVDQMKNRTIGDVYRSKGKTIPSNSSYYNQQKAAVFRNIDTYFINSICFSDTGVYAPTFRISSGTLYDVMSMSIFLDGEFSISLLPFLTSKFIRYLIKNFINHSIHTQVEGVKPIPIEVNIFESKNLCEYVNLIINKQKMDLKYDYFRIEQEYIEKEIYSIFFLNESDVFEIESWYARRYPGLS
jgi:hypothetical protein